MFIDVIVYIFALYVFIYYCCKKINRRKYLISVSNGYIFQYLLSLFIVPLLNFRPIAWVKLLGEMAYYRADIYYPYLRRSMFINNIAFIVFVIFLIYFEFNGKPTFKLNKWVRLAEANISAQLLDIEFFVCAILWFYFAIFYGKGFSLFGDSEMSSEIGVVYYFNITLQAVITMMTVYYGYYWVNNKRKGFLFILGCLINFLIAKRATFIMDVLLGVIVYYLYKKADLRRIRRVLFKLLKYLVVICILGIFMGVWKSGRKSDFTLLENIIYGNNFSDIRDGAFVLYGFENYFGSSKALGRTYMAALLSLLPNSISSFKTRWIWGRMTTEVIFGWQNHPGLRGGWGMEGYLNFGYIGVILTSVLSAYVFASMEKLFYNQMFNEGKRTISAKSSIILYILITVVRRITCSGSLTYLYVMLFFLFGNMFLTCLLRSNYKNINRNLGDV